MSTTIEITFTGPLFDGRAEQIIDSIIDDMTVEVANEASATVHRLLNERIQHPTPYYETQIARQDPRPGTSIVTDRGVIYGPWLEGTSPRNRTTRFRGYHAFSEATDQIDDRAPQLLAAVLSRRLPDLGGGSA
jgi:hypothetical protein